MVSNAAKKNADPSPDKGYEKRDVNTRIAFGSAIAIILMIVIIVVILKDVFILDKEELIYDASLKPESLPLRELRDRETEMLTSYKVLDATKGIYRIPVSRAMELTAEEAYQQSEQKVPTK